MLRPRDGDSGILQNDTVQRITSVANKFNVANGRGGNSGAFAEEYDENLSEQLAASGARTLNLYGNNFDSARVVRTDSVKNIGVTAYLRIY